MSIFSNRLISLRKEKGLTQEELAKLLCKKRSTISGYEIGGKEPDFDTLCLMSKFFDVSVDYMLGISDFRSNADDVLYRDNTNFKKHYSALPAELKITVSRLYDDFYVLLSRDIQTANGERLNTYAELFKTLRECRSDIKKHIENSGSNLDPEYLSELMNLQNNLKTNVSSILDKLMNADIETVFKIKNESNTEALRKSAT